MTEEDNQLALLVPPSLIIATHKATGAMMVILRKYLETIYNTNPGMEIQEIPQLIANTTLRKLMNINEWELARILLIEMEKYRREVCIRMMDMFLTCILLYTIAVMPGRLK